MDDRAGVGWRSAAAVVVGVPAVIVGVAIGVPHAAAGLSVTAALGVLSLLVGVGALALAGVRLWRGSRWLGRLAGIAVVLLVIQFVMMPVGQAVFATNRAPTPLGGTTPAEVGLEYRDVSFRTGDGVALGAWYIPSRDGAAVILRHGAGSARDDVLQHARVLAEAGYGVLMTDARGHGGSDGRAMDLGWYGDADIAAAAAFLREADDVDADRIAIVGLSMGGEEAIGAAAAIPELRAVVAEGVTGRRGADWLASRPAGPGRWASTVFYAVQDATAAVLSGAEPPRTLREGVRRAAPRRVLVVAAGTRAEDLRAAELLRSAAPDSVQVWEVPGAEHIGGLTVEPDAWEQRVIGFLDEALPPAG